MVTESRFDPHERILIRTKLSRPQLPTQQVVRPRLMDRLASCPACRFTLISAPAGYGKTTTVLQHLEQSYEDVAWLSLDRGDSDTERFSHYLVAAVQGVRPGPSPTSV